eukprot:CAMPEP_0172003470 /NCGR_PEP_ID=MMETSP1041-20130122/3956_1 /TAXON_ID=464988 /ORGANISM="Hemiselmis andersenii, Strain CCMP439" /LENGTH=159 /DNA_ID=CAMNT_0012657251 /DNA_START=308 /DNA_END=785 /DNA_ORIENTATION=+
MARQHARWQRAGGPDDEAEGRDVEGKASGSEGGDFTRADQLDLNRYAGYNLRCKELESCLQELQEEVEGFKMSQDEMARMDPKNPDFMVKWGSVYSAEWTPEEIETFFESKLKVVEKQMQDMRQDIDEMRGNMAVIGARLKDKFGDEVRLDDEGDSSEE